MGNLGNQLMSMKTAHSSTDFYAFALGIIGKIS